MLTFSFLLFIAFIDRSSSAVIAHETLTDELKDGTFLTFLVNHTADAETIGIYFYEVPEVSNLDSQDGVQVLIRRGSDNEASVTTRYSIEGEWYDIREEKVLIDGIAPARGLWRIDIYKLNEYRFVVFLQGYFCGISSLFRTSLTTVQSFYLFEEGAKVEQIKATISIKGPNEYSPLPEYFDFTDLIEKEDDALTPIVFRKFNTSFPVPAHIDISSLTRVSGNAKNLVPILGLRTQDAKKGDKEMHLAIVQKWENKSPVLRLVRIDKSGSWKDEVICSPAKSMGDLQHIRIERIDTSIVTMTVVYSQTEGKSETACTLQLTESTGLDGPVELVGIDGARPLHYDYSTPRKLD